MFGARIVDRDHERLVAELDFLRMEEPPRPTPSRPSVWRMLRVPTGGFEHIGGATGRLASVR